MATSQEHQGLLAATRSQESSLEGTLSPEGDNPAHTLNQISSLQNRDNKFVILSHQTCGTWLSRPQETKTGAKCVFLGPASSLLSKVGMR